jgi:hypothetical protein
MPRCFLCPNFYGRYHKYARVGTYHNIQTTKKEGRQNEHQNDGIVYMHGGTKSADLTLAV